MYDTRDIGLDVHQATISAAVLDSSGKLAMESILETKAATITDLSEPYVTDIRAGKRVPHPRHWPILAGLVGVRGD